MSALGCIDQVLSIRTNEPSSFFTFVCCRSDNCLMVINGGTNRVLVYSPAGKLLQANYGNRLFNKRLTTPSLITELPNQMPAIFDSSTKQIKKFSRSEDLIATFEIGLTTYSLNVNPYGHMVMTHETDAHKRVVSVRDSETGYVLHYLQIAVHPNALLGSPFYAVYTLPSNIITLDQSSCTVSQHAIDGTVQYSVSKQGFLQGNLHSPTSMCTDIRGNIVVADTRNDRIVRYKRSNLKLCDILLTDISRPLCVAFDKLDHLIVMTAKNCLMYDYDIRNPPTAPMPALIDGLI